MKYAYRHMFSHYNIGEMLMINLYTLRKDINAVRTSLYELINKKQGNLLDSEIISVSQQLDILINKYNEILKNMKNR